MALYRVLVKSFINNVIVEEGDIVDMDGEVSGQLELIEGKAAKAVDPAIVILPPPPEVPTPESLV